MWIRTLCCLVLIASPSIVGLSQNRPKGRPAVQRVTVRLAGYTYTPGEFRLRRGVPARITFIKTTEGGCGGVVTIPKYGIRRDLPVGRGVMVEFTPNEAGIFNFACGMDMLRGTIVVQ